MLGSVGIMNVYAYDFSAVCETGQTLYYTRNGNNVTVTAPSSSSWWDGYTKPTGELVIPGSVTYNNVEYIVTAIARNTFRGCNGLTSVTIGNTVTSIGEYAFLNCKSLTDIIIPNTVKSLGEGVFCGCDALRRIQIPTITYVPAHFFDGCKSLAEINYKEGTQLCLGLSTGVTAIGAYAFYECAALSDLFGVELK